MKKICVITGTRAEYGLLRWIIDGINKSKKLQLQLVATGMHLSPEFGLTVNNIEKDGHKINKKIEMLLSSDTPIGITKSIGLGLIGFADTFAEIMPDLVLLLGDRFEAFSAATAAMVARIPIAHIHGGEATEGLIDESIRHSITKMSHIHFVAAEEYRQRVIQLGEQPKNVFNIGAVGLDNLSKLKLMTKIELEKYLEFKLFSKNLLITFHPVTLEEKSSSVQMNELLNALDSYSDVGLIFTMPNADTDGRILFNQIMKFCANHKNAKAFTSLGQIGYLSCMRIFDGVVGNSSSGLIEAPSLKKGTINIGDRQRGRLQACSVIQSEPKKESIQIALDKLFSMDFQLKLKKVENPYGEAGASNLIIKILESKKLSGLLKKRFFDI